MIAVGGKARKRATASGRYDTDNETVVLNRVLRGQVGKEVLTPLRLPSGSAVLVDRGWIPADAELASAKPPRGKVELTGVLTPPEPKRPLVEDEPSRDDGVIRRIDPARVQERVRYPLLGGYLLLQEQRPRGGRYPVAVPLPELSEGSHLSYAVQWFLFVPTLLAVYGALLRRQSRQRLVSGAR
jgi:cytochrome oxidase assembly protein ShyY1